VHKRDEARDRECHQALGVSVVVGEGSRRRRAAGEARRFCVSPPSGERHRARD